MKANRYRVEENDSFNIRKFPTNSEDDKVEKEEIIAKFEENLLVMKELQEKLYADAREGLIVVIQALDAAGKDSTIKHVMTGFNPAGVHVHSFKAPSSIELSHDYLWRIHANVPARGEIAIFNRSHYEDVVAVQVRKYYESYVMADRIWKDKPEEMFKKRYRQIRDFEEYLYENSYKVVKIFLNISKDKQKERFLERIEKPEKNWKFNASDLIDRDLFDKYLDTFEEVIEETSTEHSPWYVLPADQKWYTRYLVSEIMIDELKKINPKFPEVSEEDIKAMAESKARLEAE